ncbi:hypothetical protein PVAP13_1KG127900 [Panicum virgatum]|uniref:Uncharacterized protein n=1 Tax=Panicum virgatum TaxID=38727 RepID=A0A8T0X6F2_PANVG|nr:hypothetical protein PVAP13_1KG127900 [Panicum virgatum]
MVGSVPHCSKWRDSMQGPASRQVRLTATTDVRRAPGRAGHHLMKDGGRHLRSWPTRRRTK